MVVVETPDSIFVSDLEHSRDVKSIVSELKEKGRKEYHQHRTVYHPWGVTKLLEQQDNYSVAEMTVYAKSSLQLTIDKNTRLQLFVLEGEMALGTDSKKKTLGAGEVFGGRAKGPVTIENKGEEKLSLIQIELKMAQ
jgi:mannose-6-phosphate isomerase-like protein (cupin superfamily)